MKIQFTAEEKKQILGIVKVWKREDLTQESFTRVQSEWGIPARLVEVMYWHVDTLSHLRNMAEYLVFKGGTCVQSYLSPAYQRASVDLDFNTTIENPNILIKKVEALNRQMQKENAAIEIRKGIRYGFLEYDREDISGTVNFRRRMPSRFGEYELAGDEEIPAKSIRVQVNCKHARFPAIKKVDRPVRFFFQKRPEITFPHASVEDLIADKILTTIDLEGFGRERFKDVYDLIMLFKLEFDRDLVKEKLGRILKTDMQTVLNSSATTVSNFATQQTVYGFATMVCKGGRRLVERWELECEELAEKILALQNE